MPERISLFKRKCIIITRPIDDAKTTAEILTDNGFDYFIEPAMSVEIIKNENLKNKFSNYEAIIITSKNAIRALKEYGGYESYKIIALGETTNSFAKGLGFITTEYAGENIKELQKFIEASYTGKKLLYASGEVITKELNIYNCGADVIRIPVYKTTPSVHLSEKFIEHLRNGKFSAIMFFSSKTAEIFNELINKHQLEKHKGTLHAICLSNNIAEKIKNYGFKATIYTKNTKKVEITNLLQNFLI